MKKQAIKCFAPEWGTDERQAIVKHVITDEFITAGKKVEKFERDFGKKHGRRAVMVNSGSSALLVATLAAGFPPGSHIITPAVTFATTISPLLLLGFIPVFVDVLPGTYNIDPEAMINAVNEIGIGKIGGAVIPHMMGNPVDPSVWEVFACTVEDACEALDSTVNGQKCGTFGTYSAFSFFGAHHLCTGEGGMVLARTDADRWKAFTLSNWGRKCWCKPGFDSTYCGDRWKDGYDCKYTFVTAGLNLKPMELQAVAGLIQLEKQERFAKIRKRNFGIISTYLDSIQDRIILPDTVKGAEPNWFCYPVTLKKGDRRQVVKALEAKGIQTRYPFSGNVVRQKMMEGHKHVVPFPLVHSDQVMDCGFVVGLGPTVTEQQAHFIGRSIYEVCAI